MTDNIADNTHSENHEGGGENSGKSNLNQKSEELGGILLFKRIGIKTQIGTVNFADKETGAITITTDEGKEFKTSKALSANIKKNNLEFKAGDAIEFSANKQGEIVGMRIKSEGDMMKQDTETIVKHIIMNNMHIGYNLDIEATYGITERIGITRKDLAKKTLPQIEIIVSRQGKVGMKFHPYGHYEDHYYMVEKTIDDPDLYKCIASFIKNAEKDLISGAEISEEELKQLRIEKIGYPKLEEMGY